MANDRSDTRTSWPKAWLGALALLLVALTAFEAQAQADLPAIPPAMACADLLGTDLTDIGGEGSRVTEAQEITNDQGIAACSVRGTLAPAITFAVVLPTDTWTGRYLQLGCGGLCGRLSLREVGAASGCTPLQAGGVAIAATDMGHQASDAGWGDDPQKRADFAHRAQHVTALAAKRLIEAFYGQPAQYSYFNGCSDGGREALIAAQRYPEDFDGILAGAPALNFQVQNGLYHAWQATANRDADGRAILLAARLPLLHDAVLSACDDLDGLADGLLADPLACTFDPATIQCEPGATDTAACLTPTEVEVVRKLHDGPRDPATGERLTLGGPQWGSELRWTVFVPETPDATTASQDHALEHLTGVAFPENPPEGFTLADVTFDTAWLQRLAALHPLYDATNPDLSGFHGAGGKLILYHGWSDTDISPLNTLTYYEAVRSHMGADTADTFARLYLVPGMYHCSQGEGPYEFDLLTPLMAWVERGEAPGAVTARQPAQDEASGFGQFGHGRGGPPPSGATEPLPGYPAAEAPSASVLRSPPLLPYPALPAFTGQGDPNDAANWTDGATRVEFTPPAWAGSAFFEPYAPLDH
ncbi:tannase/feruloyl esterase family alpha/beta hydrolase [Rubellimicrobium aerolatum]|uniref:Tannase/feruloyl esterase family alpha/beta hydrolase n=1 Tax=Rubellimicrobium aerolatum TaxID=490979 RepID=A0ABW0SCF7_9RHOB|nr:tannase/feruloyl esterase family alpha/beta hydrolase [Rubellimicrobium aerolatum]MBP1806200.1 feruloyl esterase [Rubellimicrobium aerolatum]